MTYIPADPLLTPASLRMAGAQAAEPWPGVPAGAHYFESGRVALWAALRALGLGRGDRLAVPAYICDSILPAPTALGVQVRYVPTDRGLRPDLPALERELTAGARAVLTVHYFGFPAPDLAAVGALAARHGAAMIEDCAHALFGEIAGRPAGSHGAAAIFSPWKTLPLPDGGALVLNGPAPPPDLDHLPRPSPVTTARRLVYRAIGVVETAFGHSPRLWLLRSWELRRRMQARVAEAPLVPRRASRLAEAAVRQADWRRIIARRRHHYSQLLEALRSSKRLRPLYPELPAGVCPLGFPVLAEHRERARRELLRAGVNVRAYWEQLPPTVTVEPFADAHYVADRILVLPVHQSVTPGQMSHLLRVLRRIETAPC